jgi:hypothetical protein
LEYIAKEQYQINITFAEQSTLEINYQREEEYLKKGIEDTIVYLNLRELVKREFQNIFSEPNKLVGKFREETDYKNAIKQVEKEYADNIKSRQQQL